MDFQTIRHTWTDSCHLPYTAFTSPHKSSDKYRYSKQLPSGSYKNSLWSLPCLPYQTASLDHQWNGGLYVGMLVIKHWCHFQHCLLDKAWHHTCCLLLPIHLHQISFSVMFCYVSKHTITFPWGEKLIWTLWEIASVISSSGTAGNLYLLMCLEGVMLIFKYYSVYFIKQEVDATIFHSLDKYQPLWFAIVLCVKWIQYYWIIYLYYLFVLVFNYSYLNYHNYKSNSLKAVLFLF